jgi:spoIIIJ-associated protein
MTKTNSDITLVSDKLQKLLDLMNTPATFEVTEGEEGSINVHLESETEAGLLIGKHGHTIEALELLLNLMFKQANGEWKRITVNIADWKEKEESRLRDLAESVAARAIETGKPQYLYNLSSSQRRTVHMLLAENTDVETLSEGDGAERYLIVQPRGGETEEMTGEVEPATSEE